MIIGFDAKRLYGNFTGLGNYSRAIVQNLQRFHPDHQYHLYTTTIQRTPETEPFLQNPGLRTYVAQDRLKAYWRSFAINEQLKQDGIQLFHGLSNEIPMSLAGSGIKSVVTIHDLIFKTLPHTYPLVDRTIYDWKFKNSCRKADRIIAISESTKRDIVRFYDIPPEKIEVIYQQCNPLFYQPADEATTRSIIERYQLPSEFLLYVGSIEKRKNLANIVRAYRHLPHDHQLPLVVVGRRNDSPYRKEVNALIGATGLEGRVLWITDLEDNLALQSLYHQASILVYPSQYEGFGLPVAEALLSGTPVVTSNVSSLPEAGGPASLFINPESPAAIAGAISKILDDPDLRNSMVEAGQQYARQTFNPERVTQQLIDCYQAVYAR
jgi:glycosyltransferase involved in cell wall biosynthesis